MIVPLSSHTALKEEMVTVRKVDKDRQVELAKFTNRVLKIESGK